MADERIAAAGPATPAAVRFDRLPMPIRVDVARPAVPAASPTFVAPDPDEFQAAQGLASLT